MALPKCSEANNDSRLENYTTPFVCLPYTIIIPHHAMPNGMCPRSYEWDWWTFMRCQTIWA